MAATQLPNPTTVLNEIPPPPINLPNIRRHPPHKIIAMPYNSHDFQTNWSDYRDVVLLELIKKKADVINMGRTVLATGVVALVTEKFIKQTGDEYTEYEVVQRMKYLKRRYLDFEHFISTAGIAYDFVNNVVTAGEAYFTKVELCTVS